MPDPKWMYAIEMECSERPGQGMPFLDCNRRSGDAGMLHLAIVSEPILLQQGKLIECPWAMLHG